MSSEQQPKMIESVNEIRWFENVLEQSRKVLDDAPDYGKPSWYVQYETAKNTPLGDA